MAATPAESIPVTDDTPDPCVETPTLEKAKDDEPLETCDLCNKTLKDGEEMAAHIASTHAPLARHAAELAAFRPRAGDGDQETTKAVGREAFSYACKADGGAAKFRFVQNALQQLREVCKVPFPKATLFAFGSCLSLGTYDGEGDVDLTLVDADGWVADPPTWPPKDEAQVIKKLARTLRSAGFAFEDLEPVLHTRVPVIRRKHDEPPLEGRRRITEPDSRSVKAFYSYGLTPEQQAAVTTALGVSASSARWHGNTVTFVAPDTTTAVRIRMGLETAGVLSSKLRPKHATFSSRTLVPEMFLVDFDLSARAHGVRNSLLIRAYMEQSPIARAGSVFVKKWSKRCGLNNSVKGFITSYAVTLLWIHFLIAKGHVKYVSTEEFPARPDPEMEFTHTETIPAAILQSQKASADFMAELGVVLRDFFVFYGYAFDWEHSVVSVSEPVAPTKERLGWTLDKEVMAQKFRDRVWYRMCLEDPFEFNLNLGRHLSPNKVVHALNTFRAAARAIDEGRPQELLADYTASAGLEAVTHMAAEQVIGVDKVDRAELAEHLYAKNPRAMAAMAVEYGDTKVFANLGMELTADQKHAAYTGRVGKRPMVSADDRPLYEALKVRLAEQGPLGLNVTPEVKKAHITHALVVTNDDGTRAFATTAFCDVFTRHHRVATKLVDASNGALPLAKYLTRMQHKLETAFVESVAMSVVSDTADFSCVDGVVKATTVALGFAPEKFGKTTQAAPPQRVTPAAPVGSLPVPKSKGSSQAPEPITRSTISDTGPCSGCRATHTKISPTSDPLRDPGWYCNNCWKSW